MLHIVDAAASEDDVAAAILAVLEDAEGRRRLMRPDELSGSAHLSAGASSRPR